MRRDSGTLCARSCWTLEELEATDARFAPSRLPFLVREFLLQGPPAEPLDVGV